MLNQPGAFDDRGNPAEKFLGAWVQRVLANGPGGPTVSIFFLSRDRNRAVYEQGVASDDRRTIGMRASGAVPRWDYALQASHQYGSFGAADISADGVAGDVGWHPAVPGHPRVAASFGYASGDSNPKGDTATGFDTVFDRPFFIGGPFSFFSHQGFNLAGTAVNFKQRDSLVIDFRTSKSEGQANFVNPGTLIFGYGFDADILPKLKSFINVNYIRTVTTETTELVLFTNHASNDFALDCSIGFEYRPLLTNNIIITAGSGFLIPRWGYKDIYRTNTVPVFGFPGPPAGHVDPFLYSAIVTLTLTY